MSVTHILEEVEAIRPGRLAVENTEIHWGDAGIIVEQVVGGMQLEQLELTRANITSIQLARNREQLPPHWLKRLFGAREGVTRWWLLAQLRGRGGQRVRLCAPVEDAALLDGLTERQRSGLAVAIDPLLEILKAARSLGAELVQVRLSALDAEDFQAGAGTRGVVAEEERSRYAPPLAEGERFRDRVIEQMREDGFLELYTHAERLERERRDVRRTRDELAQRISIWDRLNVFSDTPDEARVGDLQRSIADLDARIAETRDAIGPRLASLGQQMPPLGVAQALERVEAEITAAFTRRRGVTLARRGARRDLLSALDQLAERLLSRWIPDFDMDWVLDQLRERSRCQGHAERATEEPLWIPDPIRGVMPVGLDELVPAMAKSLLEHAHFESRAKLVELSREARRLAGELDAARRRVSWWSKLNVFSKSPDEFARDDLEVQHAQAVTSMRSHEERTRASLREALAVYPPLALYQRVVELAGAVSLLDSRDEPALSPDGAIVEHRQLIGGGLLAAALERACATLPLAFDGLELPREMLHPEPRQREPVSHFQRLIESVVDALDEGWAPKVREDALHHALMVGTLRKELATVRDRVSFIDVLAFWSDTPEEKRARELRERLEWHEEAAAESIQGLLIQCRKTARDFPPFALRDAALRAIQAVGDIHTDSGSSSTPKSCSVYGRGAAMNVLQEMRGVLSQSYGLSGSRDSLLRAAYEAAPRAATTDFDSASYFPSLDPEAVAGLLAHHLVDTPFREIYPRVMQARAEAREGSRERAEVREAISIWDRVNIFKTTDAEQRDKELERELEQLDARLSNDEARLLSIFHEALAQYPPARLYFELDAVMESVEDISAYCESYTVTRGSGKNRRTETRYRCRLTGLSTAKCAMQGWSARLVSTFGSLPGYRELIRIWSTRAPDPETLDAYRWER